MNPKKSLKFCLLFIIGFLVNLPVISQDFTDIHKKKAFSFSGNISLQNMFHAASAGGGPPNLSLYLQAQFQADIFGIPIPLSLGFGKGGFSYAHPFQHFSLNPSYKWIKAYIGRSHLKFSDYGLSNHSFDGIGLELSPEKIPLQILLMYGRFLKAFVPSDTADFFNSSEIGNYRRMGYAFKIKSEFKQYAFALHLFKAKDKLASLPEKFSDSLLAKENLVLGTDIKIGITEGIFFDFSYSLSIITQNQRSNKSISKNFGIGLLNIFMPYTESTSLHSAFKGGLQIKSFRLNYERISPNYESLGAYYFSGDFENISLSFGKAFNTLHFSINTGIQRDDLRKEKQNRMFRFAGSADISYSPNPHWYISASYSNFLSQTTIKNVSIEEENPLGFADTLFYRQHSQQAQTSIDYRGGSKEGQGFQINYMFSFQEVRENKQEQNMHLYASSLRWNKNLSKIWRIGSSLQWNMEDRENEKKDFTCGPSINGQGNFFNSTLRFGCSTSYYIRWNKGSLGHITSLQTQLSYALKSKHLFNLQGNFRSNLYSKNKNIDIYLSLSYQFLF